MLVTNRGIVIIMTNPQKTVFLIKMSCFYAKKLRDKKKKNLDGYTFGKCGDSWWIYI